jgi:hypothetical protein
VQFKCTDDDPARISNFIGGASVEPNKVASHSALWRLNGE